MIGPDRDRTGYARDASLLEGFVRRRLVLRQATDRVALGNDPALRFARGDQQDTGGSVRLDSVGKRGNLLDRLSPEPVRRTL